MRNDDMKVEIWSNQTIQVLFFFFKEFPYIITKTLSQQLHGDLVCQHLVGRLRGLNCHFDGNQRADDLFFF